MLWWPEIFHALTQMFWSLFDRDSSMISGVICECARISARAQFSAPRTASLAEHQVTLDKTLTMIQSRLEWDKWTQMTTLLQNWFFHLLPREKESAYVRRLSTGVSIILHKGVLTCSWIWTGFMSGLNEWSPFLCGVDLRRSHSSAAGEDAVRADQSNQRPSTRILHGALSWTLPSRARCDWFCSPSSSRAPVREADANPRLWISGLFWARRDMNKCSKTLSPKLTIYTAKISSRWTLFQSPISQTPSRWHSPCVRISSLTR